MKLSRIALLAGLAATLSAPALAADEGQIQATPINAVSNLPDGTEVTITGTVENFDSRHPFTLRDGSGAVDVDMSDAKPIVLHDGEKVTITGDVDKGFLNTNVAATDVRL